jgi:uncharacterized protein YecT (DUF1311 family)
MKRAKIVIFCILMLNIAQAKDLTQADLNQAASQHYSSSDFMLNKAYKQLMGVLEKDRKGELKKAQEAWLKFRDLNAKFIANGYKGGSIAPLIQYQALIELTQNRTAELTKMHLEAITP